MLTGCITVLVLLFPVIAPAQDTDALVPSAIGGDPLPAPVSVRFWNYVDLIGDQNCIDLPLPIPPSTDPQKVKLFEKTITTNPTTTYIEVIWTGQFTVKQGTAAKLGIYFNVYIKQGTMPQSFFPGAASPGLQRFNPVMVLNADSRGQMSFSGFRSVVAAQPNMDTKLIVQAFTKIKVGTICFQNLTVRYD